MIAIPAPWAAPNGGAPHLPSPAAVGTAGGGVAALIWASYLAFAKVGVGQGLLPQDFALLRIGTAGLVMLPWLLRHDPATLAGVGWRRAAFLALFAGPAFILLSTSGYRFAPLAHGAVIQPATVSLASMVASALLLGEPLTRTKAAGVALIVAGLAVIALRSSDGATGDSAWIGDLCFVGAGLSWTAFTILLKRWNLGAVAATAAVSALSATIVVPAILVAGDLGRIAALPVTALLTQILVQGLLTGVVAIIAFGLAVRHLGAARAALFPAIVPAATLVVGIAVTGIRPSPVEWIGASLATLGLLTAIGLFNALPRPRFTPAKG